MVVTCWSVKGGSGTTVVAATLAVLLSRRLPDVLVVDGGGDLPTSLGLPEPAGPALADWLAADDAPDDALRRLEVPAGPHLALVAQGSAGGPAPAAAGAGGADRLLRALADRRTVVVDAGPPSDFAFGLAAGATVSLLVLRPCYLALRRAMAAPVRPSGVILVEEPRRALDVADVEEVLGVPVRAVVPWDPAVARCVDAGLLGSRVPRLLAQALRGAA